MIAAGALLSEGGIDVQTGNGCAVLDDLSVVEFGIGNWHNWRCWSLTRIGPPVELLAGTSV